MDREQFFQSILPYLGGPDNISRQVWRGNKLFVTVKDVGTLRLDALEGTDAVAAVELDRGRVTVTTQGLEKEEEMKMAKKDYAELSRAIIENVGGKDNITVAAHCITRLRLNVNDRSKVNDSAIKALNGVLGSQWSGEQYQIIIGQTVPDLYEQVCKQTGLAKQSAVDENPDGEKKKFNVGTILDSITGSIIPLIPVLLGCGMIKIVIILCEMTGILNSSMPTHQVLTFVGDAGFYFLPVLVGATAARKFGGNMALGMLMGAIFIHPSFVAAVSSGTALTVYGIPVYAASYSSSLFPTILSVYVMSKIEKFVGKHSPASIRSILEPMITILVMAPLALCILGPIGALLGTYLSTAVIWLHEKIGFLSLALFTSLLPLLVMTGTHTGFIPYVTQCFADYGREPLVVTANLLSNLNQGAACAAVGVKTKDKDLRATAFSCAATAILGGVTEPGMFGVTIRFKTPLYGAMIGSFVGASLAGIMNTYAYALGSTGIFGIAMYVSEDIMNLVWIIVSIILGMAVTFGATMILYKDNGDVKA